MKKLVIVFLAMLAVGCGRPTKQEGGNKKEKDPITLEMELCGTKLSRQEYLDSCLKDWPFPGANGNWIPSRDGLNNSDTIVDGFPYNRVI